MKFVKSIKEIVSRSSQFEREMKSKCVGQPISARKPESGWIFTIGDQIFLGDFLLWRLIGAEQIELSGEDHGHWFGLNSPVDVEARFNDLAAGAVIEDVLLDRTTGDLALVLSGGYTLQILVTSFAYECWTIHEGPNFLGAGISGGVV